jgi:hypothetical protein
MVLGLFAVVSWGYAACGLVFGHLPLFVLAGFEVLQGPSAVLGALGSAALGVGFASYVAERHGIDALAARAAKVRKAAIRIALAAWCFALALVGVAIIGDLYSLARPIGLAPSAEWPLWPLPWVWHTLMPFAKSGMGVRLILLGAAAVAGMLFFMKLKWGRPSTLLMGLALLPAGAWFIGDAAWMYASARGLGGHLDAVNASELRDAAGLYNAWTGLAWWTGLGLLGASAIVMSAGVLLPAHTLDNAIPDRD